MKDCYRKGRLKIPLLIGSAHNLSKLTETQVVSMRSERAKANVTLRALAEKYGVSIANVNYIVRRKTWTHV